MSTIYSIVYRVYMKYFGPVSMYAVHTGTKPYLISDDPLSRSAQGKFPPFENRRSFVWTDALSGMVWGGGGGLSCQRESYPV